MTVQLNHTIVAASDREATAAFLSEVLGLPTATPFGPFLVVQTDNGVSLDVLAVDGDIASQHYAFLVDDADFDPILDRVRARGIPITAGPHGDGPGEINTRDGGRGFYFPDPDGHALEIITRPYGAALSPVAQSPLG